MAWIQTAGVLDTSGIEGRILAYIREHQAEAFAAATGAPIKKPFVFFADNLESLDSPNTPTLTVMGREETEIDGGDVFRLDYKIDFESIVFSTKTAVGGLPKLTADYARTLKLLLKNIRAIDLFPAGTQLEHVLIENRRVEDARFSDVRRITGQSGFVQIFQLRAVFRLDTSAYI